MVTLQHRRRPHLPEPPSPTPRGPQTCIHRKTRIQVPALNKVSFVGKAPLLYLQTRGSLGVSAEKINSKLALQ